ncbi:MAG: cytochrome c [Pseudomonadota bacterium]
MYKSIRTLACLLACLCFPCQADELGNFMSPGLGSSTEQADENSSHTLLVLPDGSGLPPGKATAAQGQSIYAIHCSACHGSDGKSGINDVLAGGQGTLGGPRPLRTVGSYWPYATTVFDFVRRAMPYHASGSLSDHELYAVTAYVLYLNAIVDLDTPVDREVLVKIVMPNKHGFVWAIPRR